MSASASATTTTTVSAFAFRCCFSVDCCLTHCCHYSANANAKPATNATTPPNFIRQSCRQSHVAVASTAAATPQVPLLLLHTNTSHLTRLVVLLPIVSLPFSFLPIVVVAPLNAPSPSIHPVGCRVASCHAATY
jgi:hypothetical protein